MKPLFNDLVDKGLADASDIEKVEKKILFVINRYLIIDTIVRHALTWPFRIARKVVTGNRDIDEIMKF